MLHMCRLQRKDSDFLELELQKFVLHWTWVLGAELGPSEQQALSRLFSHQGIVS